MSKIKILNEKKCSKCLKIKNIKREFYLAANDIINIDGYLPICKECFRSLIDMNKVETLIETMRMVDRPFIRKRYEEAMTKDNPFGYYIRMLGTLQHREWTYLNSEFEDQNLENVPKTAKAKVKFSSVEESINYKPSAEVRLKWGDYTDRELYQLEQFYSDMFNGNSISTPQHKAQLALLCKVNLEQNKALEEKRFGEFKVLNQQYNNILKDSGFRPIDRQAGGESVGIRSFSQVFEEIENDGFIPKHKVNTTQDIIDRTIMYTQNYTHRLLNMQVMSSPPEDTPKLDEEDESHELF